MHKTVTRANPQKDYYEQQQVNGGPFRAGVQLDRGVRRIIPGVLQPQTHRPIPKRD